MTWNERVMRRCGVSVGRENVYYLERAVKQFIRKYSPTAVTFWGRLTTQSRDYYVLKVQMEARESEEEMTEDHESEGGNGINKDIYYVSSDILQVEEWVRLPVITSRQMREAREVKCILTGDLNAKMVCSPPFSGTEKEYLKAQIVRIDHCCQLVVSGEYKVKSEEEEEVDESVFAEIEKEEEVKVREEEYRREKRNWVHLYPNILRQGRVSHQELKYAEDDDMEEEEKEKMRKYAVSMDPYEERLKSIVHDNVKGENMWIQRLHGDAHQSIHPLTSRVTSEQVMSLQSRVWPGFTLFSYQDQHFSIYMGDG